MSDIQTKLKQHINAIIMIVQQELPDNGNSRINTIKGEFFTKTAEYQKLVENILSDPATVSRSCKTVIQTAIGNFNEMEIKIG